MEYFFLIILGVGFSFYVAYSLFNLLLWKRASNRNILTFSAPKNRFSILVAARNEEQNLPDLIQSLSKIDYPKQLFEIIIINDHSTDHFNEILSQFPNIKSYDSPYQGKKKAIFFGIQQTQYEWIVQTDADCIVPVNWLQALNTFIEQHSDCHLIAAPVSFSGRHTLSVFQAIDMLGFMAVTNAFFEIRQPIISNGANLCYQKSIYQKIHTTQRYMELASGDDVFLLESFYKNNKEATFFLPSSDALIRSKPIVDFNTLIQQRIRWGAKTGKIENPLALLILTSVAIFYIALIICTFSSIFTPDFQRYCVTIWLVKILLDSTLILNVSATLKQKQSFGSLVISSVLHPFFIIWIAISGFIQKEIIWKDRKINVR